MDKIKSPLIAISWGIFDSIQTNHENKRITVFIYSYFLFWLNSRLTMRELTYLSGKIVISTRRLQARPCFVELSQTG